MGERASANQRSVDQRSAGSHNAGRAKHIQPSYLLYQTDCIPWLEVRAENSIQAIVTDPPYGLKEYTAEEKRKLRLGRGGVWRIPPSFDGLRTQSSAALHGAE